MEYIPRHLERKFIKMSNFFKAVLVTGARQVGKTTMLMHLVTSKNLNNLCERTRNARPTQGSIRCAPVCLCAKTTVMFLLNPLKSSVIVDPESG